MQDLRLKRTCWLVGDKVEHGHEGDGESRRE